MQLNCLQFICTENQDATKFRKYIVGNLGLWKIFVCNMIYPKLCLNLKLYKFVIYCSNLNCAVIMKEKIKNNIL